MAYRRTERSEKIRAESEHRILAAARRLFAKRGYNETTMQDIVREADTSIGNLYFYFANKEELLRALLESAIQEIWARGDILLAQLKPGAARIAAVIYTNLTSFTGSMLELTRVAVEGSPKVVHYFVEILAARMENLLKENFPERPDIEMHLLAGAIVGANRLLVERFVMDAIDMPLDTMAKFLIRSHLRTLRVPEQEITQAINAVAKVLPAISSEQSQAPRSRRR